MKKYLVGVIAASLLAGVPALSYADSHHDRWDQHRRYDEHHDWKKGDRFDRDDYQSAPVVDWRAHHLKHRKGYEWREHNGKWLEVSIATGVIIAVLDAH